MSGAQTTGSRQDWKSWALLGTWLLAMACGFWFFELRQMRPFETNRSLLFDADTRARSAEAWLRGALPAAATPGAAAVATVVHVYTPGCACNRFTNPHLQKIVARYRPRGVRFVALGVAQADAAAGNDVPMPMLALDRSQGLGWVEASPAALVFDAAGRLVYYGPYSDGARCGEGTGLVERALDALARGQSPQLRPFFGGGCFCTTGTSG
jgi:hypothetical protein